MCAACFFYLFFSVKSNVKDYIFELQINLLEMLTMFGACSILAGQESLVAPAPELTISNIVQALEAEEITSSHY